MSGTAITSTSDLIRLNKSSNSLRFGLGSDGISVLEEMAMVWSEELGVEGSLFLIRTMNSSMTSSSMRGY